jgi:NAD(P)-dependent dehydrogenase (short-subunit alcohol dehydrogenase family)
MIPRGRGTIVQIGSALAYRSIPLQAAYCGAKHAIVGFTDSIRSELLHDGHDIHLTCVHLPAVNTPQFGWCENKLPYEAQPVPPIYEPEAIARQIYDAAYSHRREVWIGWPTAKAILGERLAPGLADRYLAKHFDSQFTDRPRIDRPSNLFAPVAKDVGARGTFEGKPRAHGLAAATVTVAFHAGAAALIAGAAWLTVKKLTR